MPKEERISPRRSEILRLFASYVYLTTFHVRDITKRTLKPVERDIRWLGEKGYIKSQPHPDGDFKPRVWYPTQAGWNWCHDEDLFEKRVDTINQKGSQYLPHDLMLTDLHVRLHQLYGEELFWTQLRQHCYRRFGEGENDRVNMDAFCSFPVGGEFAVFCVEVEKSRDSIKGGKSARLSKVEAYSAYANGPFQKEYGKDSDFRILWTFGTKEKCLGFAAKLKAEGGTRRNWILHEKQIPKLTKKTAAFVTPKDIEKAPKRGGWNAQRLYSLDEA